jgi:hypothetical protein
MSDPALTSHDSLNSWLGRAKYSPDLALRQMLDFVKSAHFGNIGITEARVRMSFSPRTILYVQAGWRSISTCLPSFGDHICRVLGVRTGCNVVRANARRVVADHVASDEFWRHRSVGQLPCESMGGNLMSVEKEAPISSPPDLPEPMPARVRIVRAFNLLPESFSGILQLLSTIRLEEARS